MRRSPQLRTLSTSGIDLFHSTKTGPVTRHLRGGRRGSDICQVNLDPTLGDEIRKARPVVALNPELENKLSLAIVVPITGWKAAFKRSPFFLELDPEPRLGLRKKLAVDCFQIRAER